MPSFITYSFIVLHMCLRLGTIRAHQDFSRHHHHDVRPPEESSLHQIDTTSTAAACTAAPSSHLGRSLAPWTAPQGPGSGKVPSWHVGTYVRRHMVGVGNNKRPQSSSLCIATHQQTHHRMASRSLTPQCRVDSCRTHCTLRPTREHRPTSCLSAPYTPSRMTPSPQVSLTYDIIGLILDPSSNREPV